MPCVAHIIQSASTVALGESRFVVKKKKNLDISNSPANTAELKVQQTSYHWDDDSLIQNVPTCWNSTPKQLRPTEGQAGTAENEYKAIKVGNTAGAMQVR